MCGQGTMGLEIVDQLEEVDAIVVPVEGGTLLAGTCVAVKTLYPSIKMIVSTVLYNSYQTFYHLYVLTGQVGGPFSHHHFFCSLGEKWVSKEKNSGFNKTKICYIHPLSPGQTIATCQRNISQNCWVQHVACVWPPCCDVLRHVGSNLTIFKLEPTTPNMSQQGGQTHATCCTQQCCDMLRWHVAIVWPGLY